MKPQIPWLRVLVEGVVIVASVLLAFGIDAWWEGRQEREEERIVLASLLDEFELNLTNLEATAAAHELAVDAMRALLDPEAGSGSDLPPDSLESLFGRGAIAPHYNPLTAPLRRRSLQGASA